MSTSLALCATALLFVAFVPAQDASAPESRAATARLQLRGGTIGGNPVQVTLAGEPNSYARERSEVALDLERAVETSEPFRAWSEPLRIPARQTVVLRRVEVRAKVGGDSNGDGPLEVRAGRERLLTAQPGSSINGTWSGEARIPYGFEHAVSLTLSNSSYADASFEGAFVRDDDAVWPTTVIRARVREASAALPTATLLARSKHKDYQAATFSFQHGLRDDPELAVTRNDWDVQFGNGRDEFTVQMVTDDRSQIADLGALHWSDLLIDREPPAFDDHAQAFAGHVYYVHTLDGDTDAEALFRVRELVPGDRVELEWLLVTATQVERH
jgi:hypothetical protein